MLEHFNRSRAAKCYNSMRIASTKSVNFAKRWNGLSTHLGRFRSTLLPQLKRMQSKEDNQILGYFPNDRTKTEIRRTLLHLRFFLHKKSCVHLRSEKWKLWEYIVTTNVLIASCMLLFAKCTFAFRPRCRYSIIHVIVIHDNSRVFHLSSDA